MEEGEVWKHNGKRRQRVGNQRCWAQRNVHMEDGGQPVAKKQEQEEQDCEEQDKYSLKRIPKEWEDGDGNKKIQVVWRLVGFFKVFIEKKNL